MLFATAQRSSLPHITFSKSIISRTGSSRALASFSEGCPEYPAPRASLDAMVDITFARLSLDELEESPIEPEHPLEDVLPIRSKQICKRAHHLPWKRLALPRPESLISGCSHPKRFSTLAVRKVRFREGRAVHRPLGAVPLHLRPNKGIFLPASDYGERGSPHATSRPIDVVSPEANDLRYAWEIEDLWEPALDRVSITNPVIGLYGLELCGYAKDVEICRWLRDWTMRRV